VLLRLSEIDDISLDISGQLLSVLNSADTSSDTSHDAQAMEDDDDTPAGPIAIAVDVNEAQPAATEAPGA
jgi:exoribonuclease II